jgi:hypothetical protein
VRGEPRGHVGPGAQEILGRTLVLFVEFIPFFDFCELDRELGEKKLLSFFFQRGAEPPDR